MAKEALIQKHRKMLATWERLRAEEEQIQSLPKDKRDEALEALRQRRVKNRQFKTRQYTRCAVTGRSRGYFRYFGVCRQVLREMAHKGLLPGVKKSSW